MISKLKILLDIDDTARISKDKGRTYSDHPKLKELIQDYSVYLYSGNPDIAEFAHLWKTSGYIPKGNDSYPKADVLIDNDSDLWINSVDVKTSYKSINAFLRAQSKTTK
ncbi:MAG: hypothetical protein KF816_06555 [Melioribacteraceae bacterium]|nr:hypothetical protein [Melioribacteraceae bacterium]